MKRMVLAVLCGLLFGFFAQGGCAGTGAPKKKTVKDACEKNTECMFGLECRAPPEGGAKSCQFISFGDCEGEGPRADGSPQCVGGYRCRDSKCTVQCAGPTDCKQGELCKIGVCQRANKEARLCYDNRDCPWPETCYYGQCVTRADAQRCQTDLDCVQGGRCYGGFCY